MIGSENADGSIRDSPTIPDFTNAEVSRLEPVSSHVNSIFMQKSKPRFIAHFTHRLNMRLTHKLQPVEALIDCGATIHIIGSSHLNTLGLPQEGADNTTQLLEREVFVHQSNRHMTVNPVQYITLLVLVHWPAVFTVALWGYRLVEEVSWFMTFRGVANWKAEVKLRLSTQGLDVQAGSNSSSWGRKVSPECWITATGSPSHHRRLLHCWGLAYTWVDCLIWNVQVSIPQYHLKSQVAGDRG